MRGSSQPWVVMGAEPQRETWTDLELQPSRSHDVMTLRQRLAVIWERVRFPVVLFLFHRLGVALVSMASLHIAPQLARRASHSRLPALDNLCLWDCGWYTRIATEGYATYQSAAFWPLFPWLGRLVHWVTGFSHERSLILVANVTGLLALVVVHEIFKRLEGEAVARVGVSLLVFWPFSFFQATGLAESPMILLTALTVWLAMGQRYFGAGVALGLGILARHLSGFAGLGMVVELLRNPELRAAPRRYLTKLPALTVPFVIAAVYPFLLWREHGDPLAFVRARALWGQWSYMSLWTHFTKTREPQVDVAIFFSIVLLVGTVALLFRRRWWTLAAFAVPLMAAVWALNVASLGRYAASIWPVYLPLAVWLARRPGLEGPIIGMLAMTQAMLLYLFVHNFPVN